MGYYINIIPDQEKEGAELLVPPRGKADFLLANVPGAREIEPPTEWQPDLVCVVENGMFDAAAHAYSAKEMEEFLHPDGRRRRWLIVPNAEKLAR